MDELNLKDFECLNAIVEQTEYDNQTVWRYLCEKKKLLQRYISLEFSDIHGKKETESQTNIDTNWFLSW